MPVDKETVDKRSPNSEIVEDFHRHADTDATANSIHHTLGLTHMQAAFGDHNHRDGNGRALLDDFNFTGSRSLNTATVLKQVIDALVALGASDNTVA